MLGQQVALEILIMKMGRNHLTEDEVWGRAEMINWIKEPEKNMNLKWLKTNCYSVLFTSNHINLPLHDEWDAVCSAL
jgi:hypothetical protein